MLAAADVGQTVVAAIMGLGAAGVAGGVVAMTWSLHLHQIELASRLARREASEPAELADQVVPVHAGNGNGNGAQKAAAVNGVPPSTGPGSGVPQVAEAHRPAPPSAIEGPDSVVTGEQARYRVRRSATQQVVSWAAGGGAVSQASDPAHPDDLLLVAGGPGNLTVSVRLREGLAERRETKAVTVVASPAPGHARDRVAAAAPGLAGHHGRGPRRRVRRGPRRRGQPPGRRLHRPGSPADRGARRGCRDARDRRTSRAVSAPAQVTR